MENKDNSNEIFELNDDALEKAAGGIHGLVKYQCDNLKCGKMFDAYPGAKYCPYCGEHNPNQVS